MMKFFSGEFAVKKYRLMILFSFLLASVLGAQRNQSSSETLVLESADSNENHFSGGEFVSILRGNVIFTYDDMRIHSDEATWWKNRGVVNFDGNVGVTRPSQVLTCERMRFTRDNNMLVASGSFFFFDTLEQTALSGNDAQYRVDTKEFILKGDPRLVRIDTAAAETLIITGRKMTYTDDEKTAGVLDDVKISKGMMSAVSGKANYFTETNSALLLLSPRVYYETHKVHGDSIELFFGDEVLSSARVMGNSFGLYTEISQQTFDTMFTNVWSDTMLLKVSGSGILDSMYAFGNVLTRYYGAGDTSRVNEASGRNMILSFGSEGKLKRALIKGGARSVYYVEETEGRGRNEASGDSIVVLFDQGKTSRIRLSGSTRGTYYPQ